MVNGMVKEKKVDVFTCKSKAFKPILDFFIKKALISPGNVVDSCELWFLFVLATFLSVSHSVKKIQKEPG
jgi:hypothetical protein